MGITEGELEHIIDVIKNTYGYDFSGYGKASLLRRVNRYMAVKDLKETEELKNHLLSGETAFEMFLQDLTVNVTELFRDPSFFKAIREKVVPALKTYPYFKIWDAGCSTGEEVYSLAIILKEEEAYDKCKIYATDINQKVLKSAREGAYSMSEIKEYTRNYFNAGGKASLSDYYTGKYGKVTFHPGLKKNLVFAAHNLAMDNSFNEFNLIVCRNVLIYFQKELQERAIRLFLDSLSTFGYLALGTKESLLTSKYKNKFEVVDLKERIYRKISD